MQGTESDFSDGVDGVQFVFAVNNSVTNIPTVETRICYTNISFLIDTGASINIIDYQSYQKIYPRPKLQPHSPMIYAYGSQSALPVIGNLSTQIIHKYANTTSTFYVVKTDSKLTHGNLLSDETAQKLGILQFALSSSMQANVTPMNVSEQLPRLFADGVGKISDIKIKLHIDPSVQPVSQRHRRIPFHVRKDVEAELDRLEKLDIIEKVDGPTPWVSPIVVVPKADGGVRLCIDMREPNKAIKREKYIMPTLGDLISDLNGSTVFSKLDLSNAYHQLELDEASRQVTTFTTHAGIRRYKRLLFGVNAVSCVENRG